MAPGFRQYNGPSTNGYVGPVSKLVTASPNGVPVSLYCNLYAAPLRIDLTVRPNKGLQGHYHMTETQRADSFAQI